LLLRIVRCPPGREFQDNPPPLPVHVYKLFFLCRRDGAAQPPAALGILDIGSESDTD
jgi:hypothetical protein